MKLSIDIDGVLADFTSGVIEKANKMWPNKMPQDYVPTNWNYTDVLTKSEFSEIFAEIKKDPYFWEERPVYEDNINALQAFLRTERDHEIYYVTSRVTTSGRPVALQTEAWLIANHIWPEENYHAVIPVVEPGLKKFVMADLGIQFSVDDYGPTIEECKSVKNHNAFLLDRPWNRDRNYGTRVFNLEHFFNIVTGKMPVNYYIN